MITTEYIEYTGVFILQNTVVGGGGTEWQAGKLKVARGIK